MTPIPKVDIASGAFKAIAYPFYARLRQEAPVHRVTVAGGRPAWLISRYDDVAAALRDERLIKNRFDAMSPEQLKREPWVPSIFKPLMRNMLDLDPPDHTRLRNLVSRAFTSRLVEGMRGRMQQLADELLLKAAARGSMDLIHDYALPIPSIIIAELLGVPPEDRHRFHTWSGKLLTTNQTSLGMLSALPAGVLFLRYVRRLVAARRMEPRDDLIGSLVRAEESGDQLSEDELVAMIFLLLIAGHETTVNLIGNGTLALLQNPDSLEQLRSDPGLIRSAVEELLRYDSPVATGTERYAREDITLHGVTIPRGEQVFVVIASANRDEAHFANAERLELTREPNRHLSFGLGPHYCLGAPLARIEAQVAISTLLDHFRTIQLAVPPASLRWRPGLVLRGLEGLPLKLSAK